MSDEERNRLDEITRIMRACGAFPPQEFIDHYVKTGVIDGRLWPLRWSVRARVD